MMAGMSLKPLNLLNLHSAGKQECFEQLSLQNTAAAAQSVRSERGIATDLSRMQVWLSMILVDKIRKSENLSSSCLLLF
jgi:hypothetical protein